MNGKKIEVRELTKNDIEKVWSYWGNSSEDYLKNMGADPSKMPGKEDFSKMLKSQLKLPFEKKAGYAVILDVNGVSSGHCNINKIVYGASAFMHLHIWKEGNRKMGFGTQMIKLAVPYFFEKFHLVDLFCEPFANNPGPNATIEKLGFEFIKQYETIPGPINYKQEVKRWVLKREKWAKGKW